MPTTTGDLLAGLLSRAGVTHVHGVAGGALGPLMRAISERKDLAYLGTRHEAAAALMATAVFHATGRPAVCLAEQGPGTHNLMAGLGSARANHHGLLAITVSGDSGSANPSRGALMSLDAVAALRPLTKWNAGVHQPGRLVDVFRTALRQALEGTPGPVHIDIPRDVLAARVDADAASVGLPEPAWRPAAVPCADEEALAAAAALLVRARRPLVIAGGGANGADGPLRRLVRLVGAAATATQSGIGVVASDDPAFVGHGGVIGGPAVARSMREADVVLAVGCRFSSWLWEHGEPIVRGEPGQRLIQVDIEPTVIGQARPVSVGLVGDAAQVAVRLADILAASPPADADTSAERAAWVESLAADHRAHLADLHRLADDAGPVMHPATAARALGELIPADSLVVYDGGHTSFWTNSLTPATASRTRFHEPGMAQLGFGLPYANALAALHPDRPVVHITGDGSIGFTLPELDTARRYGLRAVHVVHNNQAWGVIRAGQQRTGFDLGTELADTDYAAVARGFGCHGERVESPEELAPAFARALGSPLPALLDVRVRFEPHPMFEAFTAATSGPR